VVAPGQTFSVSESATAGTLVGNVLATDTDPGTTLSLWQLTDPSGKFAIDAATGAISVAPGATLDFETTTSYAVSVSVWDGYRRSADGSVLIKVDNANDNPPAISAGQAFRIDDGYQQTIAALEASDPDDVNQIGFTTFSGWKIVGGNPGNVFSLNQAGELEVSARRIDWRLAGYALVATVSDGVNTSQPATISVTIPARVLLCVEDVIQLKVPKQAAGIFVLLGADLETCRSQR